MTPVVSVVVVAKDEEEYIAQCLDSLVKQDFPRESYEILVIDGGSKDRTQEICRRYPVKLVVSPGKMARQRNLGISSATGKHVAFIDADCVADKHWLGNLVEQAEASDGQTIAVGGPNLVPEADPLLSRVIGYAQETFLGSGGSAQAYRFNSATYVNSIPNCNILYKRHILDGQRYNEGINVGEDCDFNYRLRREGYKFLYSNAAVVWHHRPVDLKGFVGKMFAYGEALGQISRQHKTLVRWYAPLAGLAVLGLLLAYPLVHWYAPALYPYAIAAALYLLALALASWQVYRKSRSYTFALTAILLPVQHFSYGLGFLKGVLMK